MTLQRVFPHHGYTMQPPPDIATSSAEYAARFSGAAGRYLLEVQDASVEALLSGKSYKTLLDVGGGHGQLLGLYKKLGMDVTIHGSDEQCFARLGEDADSARTVVSGIFALPFDDRHFDVVLAVRLISHVDDWPRLLAEMCRVARFAVVIDYPSKRSLNVLTPLLFKVKRGIEKSTRSYLSFTHGELKRVFRSQGFGNLAEYKQFFLPMVIHRMLGGGTVPRAIEKTCRAVGLTRLFGSPVTLKAERDTAAPGQSDNQHQ